MKLRDVEMPERELLQRMPEYDLLQKMPEYDLLQKMPEYDLMMYQSRGLIKRVNGQWEVCEGVVLVSLVSLVPLRREDGYKVVKVDQPEVVEELVERRIAKRKGKNAVVGVNGWTFFIEETMKPERYTNGRGWYRIVGFAKMMGVTDQTVLNWIKAGKVECETDEKGVRWVRGDVKVGERTRNAI